MAIIAITIFAIFCVVLKRKRKHSRFPIVISKVKKIMSKPAFPPNQLPNKVTHLSVFSLGFTVTEPSYNHSQFSTVQQLQDSSTLESQALSSSYHPPNLLHVSSPEVVSMSSLNSHPIQPGVVKMHCRPYFQRSTQTSFLLGQSCG